MHCFFLLLAALFCSQIHVTDATELYLAYMTPLLNTQYAAFSQTENKQPKINFSKLLQVNYF